MGVARLGGWGWGARGTGSSCMGVAAVAAVPPGEGSSGDGRTAKPVHITLLNCTLTMVRVASFM